MSIESRSGTSFSQDNLTREADYLIEQVGDALKLGLSALQTYKPKDPIEYLARFLYKFDENRKYQKQMEIDADNLQREIFEYEEENRLMLEREEERKRIQQEEEEKRKEQELEEQRRKIEEEARIRAEEEENLRASKEAEEATKALLEQSKNAESAEGNLNEEAVEDGKLPPLAETDEFDNSTREQTKLPNENEEDNTARDIADMDNVDDQTVDEDPEEE